MAKGCLSTWLRVIVLFHVAVLPHPDLIALHAGGDVGKPVAIMAAKLDSDGTTLTTTPQEMIRVSQDWEQGINEGMSC